MKEQAITFGSTESLVGVLTEANTDKKLPHVIILNAGVVHHVGPGQLGVEIARKLAAEGFPSLRFDFSGIGDSAPRASTLDAITDGIADVRDAMDHLTATQGADRFILLGLCSGARQAYYVATADSRVVGGVLLDGYAFPTMKSKLLDVRQRLDRPMNLVASVNRRISNMLSPKPTPQSMISEDEGESFFPKDPTRDEMATGLATLMARNVNLLCIFSGEWETYRYEGQLREAFSDVTLGDNLTERLIDSADHLYFTRPERMAMLSMVISWLKDRFQ